MDSSILHIALYILGGCIVGIGIGWSVQATISKRRMGNLVSEFLTKQEEVDLQRDEIASEYSNSLLAIESEQAANAKLRAQLETIVSKSKILAKNVLTLRSERERTKAKLSSIQNALVSMREQSSALQTEFEKSREFYKRELTKSFEKRKALESDVSQAKTEQESLAELVKSSVTNHGSPENMLSEAHLRLGQLDVLERNVNKLETENAELRLDAVRMKREMAARDRELVQLEELRLHNQQLVSAVEALENSRQEHEADARRYQQHADQSEKESDTLRLKLDDLEQNFADIEKQQNQALDDAREAAVVPILRKQG